MHRTEPAAEVTGHRNSPNPFIQKALRRSSLRAGGARQWEAISGTRLERLSNRHRRDWVLPSPSYVIKDVRGQRINDGKEGAESHRATNGSRAPKRRNDDNKTVARLPSDTHWRPSRYNDAADDKAHMLPLDSRFPDRSVRPDRFPGGRQLWRPQPEGRAAGPAAAGAEPEPD